MFVLVASYGYYVPAPVICLQQDMFEPRKFKSVVEVDGPTTKIYRFHGAIVHPSGERIPVGTENLLLRECVLKNTDFVEGIVVYAGRIQHLLLS
jgi:phospholipid-translocating ATPase